jgi:RNA polymerase sigma-70 factor, ECF subfamily
VTTTSAPHESHDPHGRSLVEGAAAARTEALYTQYHRTVSGLCSALLRDRAEAEDAAQQTFLSAHRALVNGSEPKEPAAWLATIARNECWSRIRTRMREPLPTEDLEAVSASDPVAEAIRRADLAALWTAIEALPRAQRNALLLREFGGLSYEELAAALEVSDSAVESLLFRARRRLQVQLRAAYASLTGASWIEALVRVFAGGGAPVAAKVAALGVGAAAVGSSAVVVPHVLDNHTHVRPPAQTVVAKPRRAKPMSAATVLAEQVVPPPAVHTVAKAPVAPTVERRRSSDEGEDRSGPRVATEEERHDSSGPSETESQSGPGPGVSVAPEPSGDHSGPGRDGGGGSGRDDAPEGATVTVTVSETVEIEESREGHGGSGESDDSGGHHGSGP